MCLFVHCYCRYSKDAPELQMRRLADIAFLFQLYDFAYNTYHTAKRDFNNDHAWLHFAGALVSLFTRFHYRDNSVHLHECSPFWVGIFITFNQENYHVYCFMKTCAF